MLLQMTRLTPADEFQINPEGLTFALIKNGTGKCVTRAGAHRLLPGEILVLNATSGGKLTVQDQGELAFWNFSVCFENLLPLFSGHEISLLHAIEDSYRTAKIYPASSPVAVECHKLFSTVPAHANLDHRGQVIRIAASVLSVEFKTTQSRRHGFGRSEDHLSQAFERLSASELINLSVGDLAEKFNCSRRHLNRLFHQYFGVAVASLRMEMRLLKAMSLLRDPEAKVINVAGQCGFNHLGLFNTCFKRRFGSSPGQWRRKALQSLAGTESENEDSCACMLQTGGLCPWGGRVGTAGSVADVLAETKADADKTALRTMMQGVAAGIRANSRHGVKVDEEAEEDEE